VAEHISNHAKHNEPRKSRAVSDTFALLAALPSLIHPFCHRLSFEHRDIFRHCAQRLGAIGPILGSPRISDFVEALGESDGQRRG
jgi:hypothetical protein